MKQGWEIKKLGEVCTIQYGYAFDSSLFSDLPEEGMPLIRIRDIKVGYTSTYYKGTFLNDFVINRGDYLIGMDGEFNIEPWKSDKALLNQRVCKIEAKSNELLIRFVYRFMTKELKRIEDETSFVTVKHLSAKRLNQILIPVPPLAEQERIVAELDCLSGVIEKKKLQLKELDALAQSIFYEMFGDPITNEKGWEVKKLGEMCFDKQAIKRANKCFKDVDEIHYIDIASINNTSNFIEKTSLYVFGSAPSRAQQVINYGDILVSLVRPNLRNIAVVQYKIDSLVASSGFCVLRTKQNIETMFLKQVVLSDSFTRYLTDRVSGANYPAVREEDIKQCNVGIPPLTLQQAFASKIEAIEKQKELIKKSIKEVETLFNSRMDYYFN